MESEVSIRTSTDCLLECDPKNDYIVKTIGAFGPWQAKICIIAATVRSIGIWNMLSIVFLTPTTTFKCVQFQNNATFDAINSTCYDYCVHYEIYGSATFEKNLISEFNLICNDAWKASFTQTVIMFGFLLGVSLFGWISDRFGRRIGLLISASINILIMLMVPLSPSYWIFNALRFLIGMASGGTMIISLVLIIEIVGPEYREAAGSLAIMPDGLAQSLLALFAYFAVDWRMYLYEYSVVSGIMCIFIICLPESPRWLMAKGKAEKLQCVMSKAAKRNKINLSEADIQDNIQKAFDELMLSERQINKFTYLDLFKTKNLAFKTIASIIIWTSTGVCYYGINQYITFVGSDLYITVLILGCIQMPTSPLAVVLNKSFGRKVSLVASFSVVGLSMTSLVFVPHEHAACTVLGIIGFAASCTIFGILCVYVSELFPVSLRTMAFGLSSAGAKIGAMIAPFIATIKPHWIPSLVFAVIPFVASIFCILLPETKGRNTPEMI